jgi:hypothetical protein
MRKRVCIVGAGASCDRILDDELLRGFVTNVMREAAEIGQYLGLATPHADAMLGLMRLMAQTRGRA